MEQYTFLLAFSYVNKDIKYSGERGTVVTNWNFKLVVNQFSLSKYIAEQLKEVNLFYVDRKIVVQRQYTEYGRIDDKIKVFKVSSKKEG